ncbi:AMP-binding protein [Pseudonocardia xishanensis]|uniref:FadD3 family acyl-CoA ligase n=1 Tax=Pseudonocardia xishanensis TaxID=630995 RepID=A0ABP8RRT9_9PSEU
MTDSDSDRDVLYPFTIPGLLQYAAQEYAEFEAIVDGELRLGYPGLLAEVGVVAAGLLAQGLTPGEVVSLWAPNSARWTITALACNYVGLVLAPLNTRYRGDEARQALVGADVVGLVVDQGFLGQDQLGMLHAAGEVPGLRTVVTIGDVAPEGTVGWDALLAAGRAHPADAVTDAVARVTPGTRLQLLFTSGTTGRPKRVPHTHEQVVRMYRNYADIIGLRPGDRYLLINPFFHGFGLMGGLVSCIIRGATSVPVRRFDAAGVLDIVERERITGIPGPPTIYTELMDAPSRAGRDLSSLRLAVTGASTIPPELVRRMRTDLGFADIITAYGLSEATGCATMSRLDDPDEVVVRTSGRAVDDVQVRIDSPDGTDGEILVRGYNVMTGYADDPDATAAAIDTAGWLHTGDLGRLDENGNLHVTGRLKDIFIVGGFNVSPAEVEDVLCAHPAVSEAAVVAAPDRRLGEVGHAFVSLRRDVGPPSEEEILAWCRERLANFKVPRFVSVLPALPRAATGKVAKASLRELTSP